MSWPYTTVCVRASAGRVLSTLLAIVALSASAFAPPVVYARQPGPRAFETGYQIDNDGFWEYFQQRGGAATFGLPVSQAFPFLGCTAQFFQRLVMQRCGQGGVGTLNLLDDGLLPYTNFNGSAVPGVDAALKQATPRADDPAYGARMLEFVKSNTPDTFDGEAVNFGQKFFNTLSPAAAGTSDPNLLGLLALEIWGAPTSAPAHDPGNPGFIYQRFQRGIMHYDKSCGCTQWLLLADYLKAVITGQNLPDDLANQARGAALYRSAVDSAQPDATDFTGAFIGVLRASPRAAPAPLPPEVQTPIAAETAATAAPAPSTPIPLPAAAAPTRVPPSDPLQGDLKTQLAFQEPIGTACSVQPAMALAIVLSSAAVEFPDVPVVCISPVDGSTEPIVVNLKSADNVVSKDTVPLSTLVQGWQWVKSGGQPPPPGKYTIDANQGEHTNSVSVVIDPPTKPRLVIYPRRADPGATMRMFLARFGSNAKVMLQLYRCDVPSGCAQLNTSTPLVHAAVLGPVQMNAAGSGVFSLPTHSSSPARLYVVSPDQSSTGQNALLLSELGKAWFCLTSSASCQTENGVH
jgi:hypothetical protein